MSVEIKNHKAEFVAELNAAFTEALEKIGMVAESYAKTKCPVDTGFLRNSITHAIEGQGAAISGYTDNSGSQTGVYTGTADGGGADIVKSVYVGTNLDYAVYVELGTGEFATGGGGRPTPWVYQDASGKWHRTSGQKAQPFLKPAATDYADIYRAIFESTLKG